MIRVEIKDTGVQAALAQAAATVKDTSPLMREIAGVMHDQVEQNFDAQGRPKWEAWKPSTARRRAKRGGMILQETGRLVRSISPSSTDTTAAVGTNVAYAAIQHFGGEITQQPRSSLFRQNRNKQGQFRNGVGKKVKGGKGKSTFGTRIIKIPARPFLTLTEAGIRAIVAVAKAFFKGGK